ncbi:unnamed protein product, partial [Rangifer tarandus platyrhynchus]
MRRSTPPPEVPADTIRPSPHPPPPAKRGRALPHHLTHPYGRPPPPPLNHRDPYPCPCPRQPSPPTTKVAQSCPTLFGLLSLLLVAILINPGISNPHQPFKITWKLSDGQTHE